MAEKKAVKSVEKARKLADPVAATIDVASQQTDHGVGSVAQLRQQLRNPIVNPHAALGCLQLVLQNLGVSAANALRMTIAVGVGMIGRCQQLADDLGIRLASEGKVVNRTGSTHFIDQRLANRGPTCSVGPKQSSVYVEQYEFLHLSLLVPYAVTGRIVR